MSKKNKNKALDVELWVEAKGQKTVGNWVEIELPDGCKRIRFRNGKSKGSGKGGNRGNRVEGPGKLEGFSYKDEQGEEVDDAHKLVMLQDGSWHPLNQQSEWSYVMGTKVNYNGTPRLGTNFAQGGNYITSVTHRDPSTHCPVNTQAPIQ